MIMASHIWRYRCAAKVSKGPNKSRAPLPDGILAAGRRFSPNNELTTPERTPERKKPVESRSGVPCFLGKHEPQTCISSINDDVARPTGDFYAMYPGPGNPVLSGEEQGRQEPLWHRHLCAGRLRSALLRTGGGNRHRDTDIPDLVSYGNPTLYVLIKTRSNLYCKYAELAGTMTRIGDRVLEGEVMGTIGSVIRPHLVDGCSPLYIQRLKMAGNISMLHFDCPGSGRGI